MSRSENQKYVDLIAECDQLLKLGQSSSVAVRISKLAVSRVPRAFLQPLAKICRRAGLISRGLKLLQPVIRSENRHAVPATDIELSEYAILLSRNGSVREALQVLESLTEKAAPDALLSAAYCHMAHWDYETVTKLLEQLVQSSSDPYQLLIARVNLASAYLATSNLDKALLLCTETVALTSEAGASRLTANCFEIRGQVYFQKNDFERSRQDLRSATDILGGGPVYDQLFVRQWLATMEAIETKSEEPLLQFRAEAEKQQLWESVREADLYRLQVKFDQVLFDHLMIGTPMRSYRNRIVHTIKGRTPRPYYLVGSNENSVLELESGEITGKPSLRIENKIHHVIATLLQDLYVPQSMGSLFSELYPEEFFDVNSSPVRLRQILFRTRKWFEQNNLNAEVSHLNGAYRLLVKERFGINVPLIRPAFTIEALKLQKLLRFFPPGVSFSAKDACLKLDLARTPFLILAEQALSEGTLIKSGVGRSTKYHFKQS